MRKIGYIGNFYKIPEYIIHSKFDLCYVVVEAGKMSDALFTFLKVRNIPYTEVQNGDELVSSIYQSGIDLWITCSYGKRIPMEKLDDVAIYNIHYAELPHYKGRHPTFYATISNEKSVGISLHKITKQLDEGEIISQKLFPYYIWEDENDLFEKLTSAVPELLEDLSRYLDKDLKVSAISTSGNYFKPVSCEDITINISSDSPDVMFNKVRAQAKYNGAILEYGKKKYWVYELFFSKNPVDGELSIPKDDYYVIMKVNSNV